MAFEWDKDAVEILIECYRANECLWNFRNHLYRNKLARRIALQQVVSELEGMKEGINSYEITKKFNTLRTQYLSEVKKIRASRMSGCDANQVYKPKVWWFSRMNFLRSVLQRRRAVSDLHERRESPHLLEVHIVDTDDEDDKGKASYAADFQLNGSQVAADSQALSVTSQSLNGASSSQEYEDEETVITSAPKRILEKKFHTDSSGTGVTHIIENVCKVLSRQVPKDDASQFGEFIASKLRRIDSAAIRLTTEHEIMNVIMKAELKNMDLKLEV